MEENSYIKRQRVYKTIMLVILTAFITFILTSIFISNQLESNSTTNNSSLSSIIQNLTGGSSLQKAMATIEEEVKENT